MVKVAVVEQATGIVSGEAATGKRNKRFLKGEVWFP
jgi:hypothetical protein